MSSPRRERIWRKILTSIHVNTRQYTSIHKYGSSIPSLAQYFKAKNPKGRSKEYICLSARNMLLSQKGRQPYSGLMCNRHRSIRSTSFPLRKKCQKLTKKQCFLGNKNIFGKLFLISLYYGGRWSTLPFI